MLYVVSTPIGNLDDITFRAVKVLQDVDIIVVEDTRRASILFKKYNIRGKKLIVLNEFNEKKKTPDVVTLLKEDKKVAIITDSGTPSVSDPGFYLIREAVKNNILVVPVPGVTAFVAALVASGFATDTFEFYGFIPKKDKAKTDFFNRLKNRDRTVILYESPYRLLKTLEVMKNIMPRRRICICREMTKKFEEFIRGTVEEVYTIIKNKEVKGEITMVLDKL